MRRHVEQKYYLLSLFVGVAGNGVLSSWKESCKCRRQWVPYRGSQSLCSSLCCSCFCSMCVPGYSCLSSNSWDFWNWTWKDVVTNSPSLLFLRVCYGGASSVGWWKCERLWQLVLFVVVDTGCGILLLERWFLKAFLHPSVNGLIQDELSQNSDDYSV